MTRFKGLQELFKRYRRPGDIVFAWAFVAFAIFLATQLSTQARWKTGGKTFSQPAFWPTVSIALMIIFGTLHLLSSAISPRIEGRWTEVWQWVKSVEYAGWFLAYVFVVPIIGYLPGTILFGILLALRAGYRSRNLMLGVIGLAFAIVVIFKAFLQVKIPGGGIYEALPSALRSFMLTYF